jgi:hypothetical protein
VAERRDLAELVQALRPARCLERLNRHRWPSP